MKSGRIVETGSVQDVFRKPDNNYTQKLLESIPEKV
jgi:ABC-type dipeptide/oligopeptide/nickel transport system ATPase component